MLRREFPEVRLIANGTNLYFTPANQLALGQSSSRYVLLLNDDTELLNNAIYQMFLYMEAHTEAGACGCVLRKPDGSPCPTSYAEPSFWLLPANLLGCSRLAKVLKRSSLPRRLTGWLGRNVSSYLDVRIPEKPTEVQVLSGACLFFRREIIGVIGDMDGRFKLGPDDWDWCIRIRRAHRKIFLLPEPQVLHIGGASTLRSMPPVLEFYRGWFYFCVKHYGWLGRVLLLLVVPLVLPPRILTLALRRRHAKQVLGELSQQVWFHSRLMGVLLQEVWS
jgi:GT2 family glycosyltransferase